MPPKGKQGTKGQKQIADENKDTLDFYVKIILTANLLYAVPTVFFYRESFTFFYQFVFLLTTAIYYGSYRVMKSMSTTLVEDGNLMDGGVDLNCKDGMAEHIKDLILLTVAVQILSLLSNYFWLLMLLAPGRAMYILWVNILGPWFFAEAPEVDDKKAKKLERKMKRRQ